MLKTNTTVLYALWYCLNGMFCKFVKFCALWEYSPHRLEHEALVGNIYNFCPFLKENTSVYMTKISLLMLFREIIVVYCDNHLKYKVHCMDKIQSHSSSKQVVSIVTTGL
jgi:hypothetical protein